MQQNDSGMYFCPISKQWHEKQEKLYNIRSATNLTLEMTWLSCPPSRWHRSSRNTDIKTCSNWQSVRVTQGSNRSSSCLSDTRRQSPTGLNHRKTEIPWSPSHEVHWTCAIKQQRMTWSMKMWCFFCHYNGCVQLSRLSVRDQHYNLKSLCLQ